MPEVQLESGVSIYYETFGDSNHHPLLLISGFTMQMIGWDQGFIDALVAQDRYVIAFDNRDVGLSTSFEQHTVDTTAVLAASQGIGEMPDVPYTLSDNAADAVGVLDALGVAAADVVGMSMGGMIAQTMAIEHPERVACLVSVMSTVGDPDYGESTEEAVATLLAPPASTRDEAVENSIGAKVWSSPGLFDAERARRKAGESFDRSYRPTAGSRQLASIYASGDRSDALRQLTTPTLVIHGQDDTLISVSGGRRTAELVPGASLLELAGYGHDVPPAFWPVLSQAIGGFGDTVRRRAAAAGVA